MKLSDYLKAINYSKKSMDSLSEDYDTVVKKYAPFVVNRCLSYFPDTIIQSNNMNLNSHLDKRMHFDYLSSSIRRRNRFSKWHRKEENENLAIVKEYFGYSNRKAIEALSILSEKDLDGMKKEMDKGG